MSLYPVILAGGGGTRLWPLSREQYPKQFLKLFGERSLLQDTLLRLEEIKGDLDIMDPLVVCNEAHRFLIQEQAEAIHKIPDQIILEPEGRNTAPALTVTALLLNQRQQDDVIIMMPADHCFSKPDKMLEAIKTAYTYAMEDYMVTFGIIPTHAETGYGYIEQGKELEKVNSLSVCKIKCFTEKPDSQRAEGYFAGGQHFWNSGIFMMKASVWLEHIKALQPEIYQRVKSAVNKGVMDHDFFWLENENFLKCPSDSIDYAVMEDLVKDSLAKAVVIPVDAGWSDMGAWDSVWQIEKKDAQQNAATGDVIMSDSSNCLARSEHRLVSVLGCDNLVVIETADAVLVANKDQSQDVKSIVEDLKQTNREEQLTHRKVYRPWGSYENLDVGEGFQVKRLTIIPGKKLSLQSHNKRAEHWVVVKGVATVTRGEEVFELNPNESTYIPVQTKHRLENAGDELLEIIEVQSGSYLGEDDIVRYEDDFGRVDKK